jgi:hypothetical protein
MSTANLKLSVAVLQFADQDRNEGPSVPALERAAMENETKRASKNMPWPPEDPKQPNVFQMYVANGKQTGFWLRRTTWGNTCAQVVHVGELSEKPPYYGNPVVRANIYDLRSGKPQRLNVRIPCPGTYKTWRQIDPPSWASTSA